MCMIAVIDYGMGNLRSVQKAIDVVGGRTKVTSSPKDLKRCEKIVFPGVGAFGDAMKELRRLGIVDAIRESISAGKPFLGLCLGLQLLFEKSDEAPGVKGLGILPGEVKRFKSLRNGLKVPHMGWNTLALNPKTYTLYPKILKGVPNGSYMYFVHSYYVVPRDKSITITTTEYGKKFVSGIQKNNIYGFQFHPEKSQAIGLKILENFVRLPVSG